MLCPFRRNKMDMPQKLELGLTVGTPYNTELFQDDLFDLNLGKNNSFATDSNGTKFVTRAVLVQGGVLTGGSSSEAPTGNLEFALLSPPSVVDPCNAGSLQTWTPDVKFATKDANNNFILPAVKAIVRGTFPVFLKDGEKAEEGDFFAMKLGDISDGGGELSLVKAGEKAASGSVVLRARAVVHHKWLNFDRPKGVAIMRVLDNTLSLS